MTKKMTVSPCSQSVDLRIFRANHLLRTTGNFNREFVQEAMQNTPGIVLQMNKAQTIDPKQSHRR